MTTTPPLPHGVVDRPIGGQGLAPDATLGSVLDRNAGLTLLVFLRHHG
ncbi:MAG: hypothetical protein AAF962_23545 [Actinomycetota bacterium]